MQVNGQAYRTVWSTGDGLVQIIDQRKLPWEFTILSLQSVSEVAHAIKDMAVRGAGCIGVTAAYGMALAARQAVASSDPLAHLRQSADTLIATRPTAADLAWAVRKVVSAIEPLETVLWIKSAFQMAESIAEQNVAECRAIGEHGLAIIRELAEAKAGAAVNILTHCNAGWLAFVDLGSATAPIYAAHAAGIPVHVWVDETRPRNQGARLTAWELAQQGIPHTVIADNAGGHLMQHGQVDVVITGADRVTARGDAANKIGTYLKALAAADNNVPFYVAVPNATIDETMENGLAEIPIEERSSRELTHVDGLDAEGRVTEIRIIPEASSAANPAFDVTPARLITGLITPSGIRRLGR